MIVTQAQERLKDLHDLTRVLATKQEVLQRRLVVLQDQITELKEKFSL